MMKRNGDSVMKKVYLLLEKNLKIENSKLLGVYASRKLAAEVMEDQMSIYEEQRAYKIEVKMVG